MLRFFLSFILIVSIRADDAQVNEVSDQRLSELDAALMNVPSDQKEGLEFLIRYMPARDRDSISTEFLLKNVDLAYKARSDHKWASSVPLNLFYNDVLPYVSLDEKRELWRDEFYRIFSDLVKDSKELDEACLLVNQNIKRLVKVVYSKKRLKANQSPFESMQQGKASCTGLSILLVDALRSVGIPSRIVGTPSWTTKIGNHNWVEYWSPKDKNWHFIEYYPDKKGPDHGWFVSDAAKADPESVMHSIYATSWKSTGVYFPLVWDTKNKQILAVNVTKRYTKDEKVKGLQDQVCILRLDYIDTLSNRVPVEVVLKEKGKSVFSGQTPSDEDDLNKFLEIDVKLGGIYQVLWRSDFKSSWNQTEVTVPKDREWFKLTLGKDTKAGKK